MIDPDHPLMVLAAVAQRHGVTGLEVRHRAYRGHLNLRLWCPDEDGARAVELCARRYGFAVPLCDRHIHNGRYDGWQVLVQVSAADGDGLAAAMVEASRVALAPAPKAIGR